LSGESKTALPVMGSAVLLQPFCLLLFDSLCRCAVFGAGHEEEGLWVESCGAA